MQGDLIVFGRLPQFGQVKTRLAAEIGKARAFRIYTRLLARTIEAAESCRSADGRHLHHDGLEDASIPPSSIPLQTAGHDVPNRGEMLADLRSRGWRVQPQQGTHLGERMHWSMSSVRRFHDEDDHPVVLVGTDGASMTPEYLDSAFAILDKAPVVIGPSIDGGYLLIGARTALPEGVFRQAWSSPQVLPGTRKALTSAGLAWGELPTVPDVDTASDLRWAGLDSLTDG